VRATQRAALAPIHTTLVSYPALHTPYLPESTALSGRQCPRLPFVNHQTPGRSFAWITCAEWEAMVSQSGGEPRRRGSYGVVGEKLEETSAKTACMEALRVTGANSRSLVLRRIHSRSSRRCPTLSVCSNPSSPLCSLSYLSLYNAVPIQNAPPITPSNAANNFACLPPPFSPNTHKRTRSIHNSNVHTHRDYARRHPPPPIHLAPPALEWHHARRLGQDPRPLLRADTRHAGLLRRHGG
jgi:hypothetical protein